MDFILSISTTISIYVILALSLALLLGHTGIFSIAHAAVFGVGSYTYATLSAVHGVGWGWSALAALVGATLISAIMAIPSLWVVGEYFIVASLTMQYIVEQVTLNARGLTGGYQGVAGITRPKILGLDFSDPALFLGASLVGVLVTLLVVVRVIRSPLGRVLHAIRDDELVASTLGKQVRRTKLVITCLAGTLAGVAGILYAMFVLYISPASFTVSLSVSITMMIVIGGKNSVVGVIVGAVLVTMLPQVLPVLGLTSVVAAPQQQVIFGLVLILIVLTRPGGLITSDRWFSLPRGRAGVAGTVAGPEASRST
jgi:branched-chain amino acid transport system permease protein